MFQTGCIGLINASNTYNNKLNIKFSTYAYTCIKNEILKYIKKLPKYNLGLDNEICEDTCLIDLIPDNNISIEEQIIQKEFSFSIRKLLEDLSYEEKIIILMYYGFLDKKYTQKEIGEYSNMPQYKVSRVISRVIDKIKEKLLCENISEEKMNKLLSSYGELQDAYDKLDGYTINSKIDKIRMGLNITDELANSTFDKCSGGEKTRVLIAKMLLEEPDVLLLDEPTNNLDLNSREVLEENLLNYKGSLLFVSHDRYFLEKMTNKIWNINNKKVETFDGNYMEYLEKKKTTEEETPNYRKARR